MFSVFQDCHISFLWQDFANKPFFIFSEKKKKFLPWPQKYYFTPPFYPNILLIIQWCDLYFTNNNKRTHMCHRADTHIIYKCVSVCVKFRKIVWCTATPFMWRLVFLLLWHRDSQKKTKQNYSSIFINICNTYTNTHVSVRVCVCV